MKSIYYTLITALLLTATGCKKELYKDPIGLITPGQVNQAPTLNTVNSAVTASYQMLSSTLNLIGQWDWTNGTVTRPDFVLQDMASDDAQKKWNPDGDQPWMDEIAGFRFTSVNGAFNGIWSYDYEGISRCNQAIAYLTDEALISKIAMAAAARNQALAEVYFLRSFYYFDLTNNFGDVPLLLKPLTTFDEAYQVAKRSPKADILVQLNTDLDQAATLMPAGKYSSTTEKWRVSAGAITALRAKIALYSANWTRVIELVSQLEGTYSLNANYFDSFDVSREFTDNEVIFAYDHQQGKLPKNGNGLCALLDWGFLAPTPGFISAFEPGDPRLGYTVNVAAKNVNKLLGTLNGVNKGNDDSPSNKIYIRMADALLWKAEAYAETGNYSAAIGLLNQVRQRARNSATASGAPVPAGTLPDRPQLSDQDQVRSWIRQERRVELGFESQRFNDLKRWKIAREVLTAAGKNFQDKNYLYPIPQGDIDKSAGTITQNSGY